MSKKIKKTKCAQSGTRSLVDSSLFWRVRHARAKYSRPRLTSLAKASGVVPLFEPHLQIPDNNTQEASYLLGIIVL